MQTYIETASDLHSWLSSLQITQKWINAEIKDEHILFELKHPKSGTVEVTQSLPNERIFRTHGIALELIEKEAKRAKLRVYDFGGIWDPVDGYVPGEHYAASHFALLSAILFDAAEEPRLVEQASQAFEFHLYTSRREYLLSEWMYHWDFQNYALIECYQRLHNRVSKEMKQGWQGGLKRWRTNHRNKLSNWAAMRALASYQRYRLFGSFLDFCRFRWNEYVALKGEQENGCIDDELNASRPIQYHIYTVALLHRLYLLTGRQRFGQRFLRGVDFFLPFVDPDGDFNYWGRGQEQIFGYGAAVYALTAAAKMTGESEYQHAASKVYEYLLQFKRDDHFPLVLNLHAEQERVGWYDYHHTTVYNAFLGVWLGLAHELNDRQPKFAVTQGAGLRKSIEQDFAFISNGSFFIAAGGGLPHYSSESGLTPCHLWVKGLGWIYSCPGGATRDAFGNFYGDEHVLRNCLAPLAVDQSDALYAPTGKIGEVKKYNATTIECFLDCGIFSVRRTIGISVNELQIFDEILLERDFDGKEFRLFNFPVIIDKFDYRVRSRELTIVSSNANMVIECDVNHPEPKFEELEQIRTAKGLARVVAMRIQHAWMPQGQKFFVNSRFKIRSRPVSLRRKDRSGVVEPASL